MNAIKGNLTPAKLKRFKTFRFTEPRGILETLIEAHLMGYTVAKYRLQEGPYDHSEFFEFLKDMKESGFITGEMENKDYFVCWADKLPERAKTITYPIFSKRLIVL